MLKQRAARFHRSALYVACDAATEHGRALGSGLHTEPFRLHPVKPLAEQVLEFFPLLQ